LDLEIALSGASAKVKPLSWLFRTGRKCVETSDDVTKDDFTSTPESRLWDLSPMRLGAAKTARELAKSPDETPNYSGWAFMQLSRLPAPADALLQQTRNYDARQRARCESLSL
jgi:hypothetical protein